MRRVPVLLILLGASALGLALWARPAAGGAAPARQPADPAPVYLPQLLRAWFDTGPHFPLAYGPYRAGQAPGGASPSPAEILADLGLLRLDTHLLRTYSACGVLGTVPPLAAANGLALYQGVSLSANTAANQAELNCYRALAAANPNLHGALIGNEVLLRGDLTEAALVADLQQARQLSPLPVSAAETWDVWCAVRGQLPRCSGRPLLGGAVDFIAAHVHPYWEGVPLEHAAAYVVAAYATLRAAYPHQPVVIAETGWPTCGSPVGPAVPGLDNQRRFVEELWRWTAQYGVPVVYFEAFDEPWKVSAEGAVGGCWGLADANRVPKHANLDWTVPPLPAPAPGPAVTIEHPQGLTTTVTTSACAVPLFGRADHAAPGWHVKVEVYTNQWYVQDKWYAGGLAPITDGLWGMPEVILGGQGAYNNHRLRVTLLDGAGTPQATAQVDGLVRANSCLP